MFEKDAEEATLDLYGSADDVYGKEDYKQGFKNGAEFGYNKLKGKIKELLETLLKNCPNTYSGTDAALSQKRMFRFQDARNKIELFLKEEI